MTSRFGRWSLAGLGVAVALASTLVLMRLHASTDPVSGTAAAAGTGSLVQDATHEPWYGLTLLADPVTLQGPSGRPATPPPPITASAGILIDADSGRILWQENEHARLAPASLIKLLTALVVLENFD